MEIGQFFKKLGDQNLSKLEGETQVSRQALHNAIKSKNMKLDNLSSVARAMNYKVVLTPVYSEENLLSSLVKWGAPLAHSADGNLSLEVTVAEASRQARQDGLYESVVPYVLAKNAEELKLEELVGLAFLEDQVAVVGYFAEVANLFRPHKKLQEAALLLERGKKEGRQLLVTTTKMNFPELFEKNTVALKWNLLVRGNLQDHMDRWRKWEQSLRKI